ncbi:hypothetical protein Q1695_002213 [Nippostrongylus brasiliensis]|nr:hypothetical protein Q1695_002213 [Nippostrongylus brasiliensis]
MSVEAECGPSTSHGETKRNAEKKARVFDFNTIFEETRKDVEKSSTKDSGVISEEDDDFLPMLPPGFVPDKSVIINESSVEAKKSEDNDDDDYEDYTGDGIPIVSLIPTACEAKLIHSGKPVCFL